MELLAELKKGRRRAVARAISIIENDPAKAKKIVREIFPSSGGSTVIGITGPAGAGKSSLINKTALRMRKDGLNPAVLAIDPTSHLTGGAILGDRVRMSEATDSGTYIRSIASRGSTGAVSRSLRNSIRVLEYAGFDPVIVESVGAGQTEVGISDIADITVVVFNPNTGDSIQTIKAGLTEIGDVYVVNKSDLAGAGRLYDSVRDYLGDADPAPLILKTSARSGTGISKLAAALAGLAEERSGARIRRDPERLEAELRDIVLSEAGRRIGQMLEKDPVYRKCLGQVLDRRTDPQTAAERIARSVLGGGK